MVTHTEITFPTQQFLDGTPGHPGRVRVIEGQFMVGGIAPVDTAKEDLWLELTEPRLLHQVLVCNAQPGEIRPCNQGPRAPLAVWVARFDFGRLTFDPRTSYTLTVYRRQPNPSSAGAYHWVEEGCLRRVHFEHPPHTASGGRETAPTVTFPTMNTQHSHYAFPPTGGGLAAGQSVAKDKIELFLNTTRKDYADSASGARLSWSGMFDYVDVDDNVPHTLKVTNNDGEATTVTGLTFVN